MENFFDAAGIDRAPALILEIRTDVEVLHVFGELDFAALSDLRSALANIVGLGRALVVDLTRCTYIEACALGVLTSARAALDGRLRIEVANDTIVQRLFEITGVGHDVSPEPALRANAFAQPSPLRPRRRICAGKQRSPRRSHGDRER